MRNIMKRRGPELGQLSSKFFAYVQLKKKDTLRTGELGSVLGVDESQERDLLRRLSAAGWIVRLKRGVYLVPPRIPPGGKHSPGLGLILQKLMEEGGGRYQICGPTAFNFYGLDDQIPSLIYVYNDRISGTRTIGNLAFQLIRVSKERLGATEAVRTREGGELAYYSSKVRTLMDAVYDWSRFNSLPRGYGWIRQEITKDPKLPAALVDVTAQYGNKATVRRIGYLLEVMAQPPKIVNRLRRLLSHSKGLIPWIPGIPARGKVSRKWGVIVNG
jgi:predicted transcriptional regulator of viral defense system